MRSFLLMLLCAALFMPAAAAEGAKAPGAHEFLSLMSFGGTQNGGDEAAFIDEDGGLYYLDMEAEGLYWNGEETADLLRSLPDSYRVDELTAEELGEIRRLIGGIETAEPVAYGVSACDAGTLRQIVYRKLESGEKEAITLMTAGDSICENMDRNAVILSAFLLERLRFTRRLRRWSYLFPYGDTVPLSLSFERGGFFGGSRAYSLRRAGDRAYFSVQGSNGDETKLRAEIDDAEGFFSDSGIFVRLEKMIGEAGIAAWDGFDERDGDILDGDGFTLRIDYGTREIRASGYEKYPAGYREALSMLEGFFAELTLRAEEAA